MDITPEINQRLTLLEQKFTAMGQDLTSYLDGLLHANFLTYWDYIHLDTLLSLQNPKTPFHDEKIFIIYHQITELYFKLTLIEFERLTNNRELNIKSLLQGITRINRYFENLVMSFDVMVDGMDPAEFMKFRMSLLPASGFQSGQYRMIEVYCTDFIQLVDKDKRDSFSVDEKIETLYENLYWKAGATELSTGNKTLTLKQFEEKYGNEIVLLGEGLRKTNLRQLYKNISGAQNPDSGIIEALRLLDSNVNVNWPLAHYKSAVRYLQKDPEDIKATGGTNWQKYLPPRFQKRVFYPELWSEEELANWGKSWVEKNVFPK